MNEKHGDSTTQSLIRADVPSEVCITEQGERQNSPSMDKKERQRIAYRKWYYGKKGRKYAASKSHINVKGKRVWVKRQDVLWYTRAINDAIIARADPNWSLPMTKRQLAEWIESKIGAPPHYVQRDEQREPVRVTARPQPFHRRFIGPATPPRHSTVIHPLTIKESFIRIRKAS